ncbi:MAG: DNA mismatch repair endonuclease MutL [Planctomycetota bacterium]
MRAAIRQLSEDIQNKIAAGEVIERPAAVVKELIENSLDAGARRISVRIEQGGKRLIEVTDDGHGIPAEELPLALTRHATSKLRSADDLVRIGTLGFRGEALPSIAGVSACSLASCPPDGDGRCIRVEGSERVGPEPVAMPPGTRITVRNLFWNVPARLKFLKADGTETGHVTDQVQRFALGHPRIAFNLQVNGRQALDLPAEQSMADRIRSCFGRELAEHLLAVHGDRPTAQLSGFIAHPSQAKPSSRRQFVFLNGRHIHDKLLVAAIRAGYEGFLEPRLHGVVFLHLDVQADLVDVNVHPTKAEVRFRNSGEIFALVREAIRSALQEHAGGFALLGRERERPDVVRQTVVKAAAEPAIQERFLPRSWNDLAAAPHTPAERPPQPPSVERSAEAGVDYRATTTSTPAAAPADLCEDPGTARDLPPGVRRVSQVHDMYLLLETDRGLRLVDQHALHEKAIWLSLDPDADDYDTGGRQELLVPVHVELSAAEAATVEDLLPELRRFGIEAERFGPSSVLVRAHPARLRRVRWPALFSDLAAGGDAAGRIADLRMHLAHRAACTAAVKAGQALRPDEQVELAALLYRLEHMEHCPHGRPTTLDLSWEELERRFQH